MSQPLVVRGAGGPAAYNEFWLAQIAAAYPVVLADASAPACPYLACYLAVDPAEAAAAADAVANYAAGHDVGGVLACSRRDLVIAAQIARRLERRGAAVEASAACADPLTVRTVMARRRMPLTRWAEACDAGAAAAQAKEIGYPVLKPFLGGHKPGLPRPAHRRSRVRGLVQTKQRYGHGHRAPPQPSAPDLCRIGPRTALLPPWNTRGGFC